MSVFTRSLVCRCLLALALLSISGVVLAQARMINISAEGEAGFGFTEAQAACTIVTGYREFAILAEGTTSGFDAFIYAIRQDTNQVEREIQELQFEPDWIGWKQALAELTFEAEREWVRRARHRV